MKLESTKSKHPQLIYEAKLYRILQGAVGEAPAAVPRPALASRSTAWAFCWPSRR